MCYVEDQHYQYCTHTIDRNYCIRSCGTNCSEIKFPISEEGLRTWHYRGSTSLKKFLRMFYPAVFVRPPAHFFFLLFFFFFHPMHFIFALLFSLPLVVTQIRGHIAGSSPPLPTTVRALHFLSRFYFSSFFPRRLASNCAYPR